jgi:multiple sugar transport system permease protein
LAAYSLARARLPFKLNGIIAFWMLLTRMYPAIATAIPYFVIIRDLQLLDTRWALIVTYTSFNLPFVVWLMIGFYEELPPELERAAMVDGCSAWQRFTKIVLPLSAPALVATAILSAILAWNEFLFAVMLTRIEAKTLPVVMSGFITDKGMQWDQMTALGVITIFPVLVFAIAVQRYLVRGLTLGAVKE